MKTELKIDLSSIEKLAKDLDPDNSKRKTEIKKALKRVGIKIVEHALTQYPTPPIEFGNLRGSFNVIVDKQPFRVESGQFTSVQGKVGRGYEPDESKPSSAGQEEFSVRVFNGMPYALYMHEGMSPEGSDYQQGAVSQQAGDVGGGFLSRKVLDKKNIDEYKEILRQAL